MTWIGKLLKIGSPAAISVRAASSVAAVQIAVAHGIYPEPGAATLSHFRPPRRNSIRSAPAVTNPNANAGSLDSGVARFSPDRNSVVYAIKTNGVGNLWIQPLDRSPERVATKYSSDVISHCVSRLMAPRWQSAAYTLSQISSPFGMPESLGQFFNESAAQRRRSACVRDTALNKPFLGTAFNCSVEGLRENLFRCS